MRGNVTWTRAFRARLGILINAIRDASAHRINSILINTVYSPARYQGSLIRIEWRPLYSFVLDQTVPHSR